MNPLVNTAAIADLSGDEYLEITGSDRVDWLHGLCTQNISELQPGQGAYACHIDVKAKILADMQVMIFPDRIWLRTDPGVGTTLRRSLRKYIVMEDVKVRSITTELNAFGVFGPHTLDQLLGAGAPASIGTLAHHHWMDLYGSSMSTDAIVVADPRMGVPGYRFIGHPESLQSLSARLELPSASEHQQEAARIRHGIPRMLPDLAGGVLFAEAGLTTAIHPHKGCYLGQEVVERVHSRGRVSKRLLPILIECNPGDLPPAGAVIETDRKLGSLTSVAWQKDLQMAAALGFVHRSLSPPGPATIRFEGSSWNASVHPSDSA